MSGHFLWPEFARSDLPVLLPSSKAVGLEDALGERYSGAHPVSVSSARAGLNLIIVHEGIRRGESVRVFPYASHCVLDAIYRVASPVQGSGADAQERNVVYHQWGYVQPRHTVPWIEDAVDSLCEAYAELMPLGGAFELWSMPKILGSLSGGVVWCRDSETAEKLRTLRDMRGGATRQLLLRWVGQYSRSAYSYWAGVEADCGPISPLAAGEVLRALTKMERLIEDRRRKYDLLAPFAPTWLPKPQKRWPCAVPVEVSDKQALELIGLGLSTGLRHFQRIRPGGTEELLRVFPIPIHQQVPEAVLQNARAIIAG